MNSPPDVYFIQGVDGGLIKIGWASNPLLRLATLRNHSPVPLRILAVIPKAGNKGELRLHRQFDSLREHGEWFRPDPSLLNFIDQHGTSLARWQEEVSAEKAAAKAAASAEARDRLPRLHGFAEVAEKCGVSLRTMKDRARARKFAYIRLGRAWLMNDAQLEAFLALSLRGHDAAAPT